MFKLFHYFHRLLIQTQVDRSGWDTKDVAEQIPYKRKYWQILTLAIWLQTGHSKILAEFNLAVSPT